MRLGPSPRRRAELATPLKIDESQFERLRAAPSPGETWIGFTAERFSERLRPSPDAIQGYWDRHLSRSDLRKLCRDPEIPVVSAYVAVMAWGGQGRGNDRTSWQHRDRIEPGLERLRSEPLGRADAFRLFHGEGKVAGLGPSYFTKILHFFSHEPMWIMDLWTSLSVNLLFGERVVPVYGEAIGSSAGPHHYERFCTAVEIISGRLGCSPDEAEMRMFDGRNLSPNSWRKHVSANYRIRQGKLRSTASAGHPER